MSKATINRFLTILSSAKELERLQLYQLLQKAEACYCLKDRKAQYEFGKALSLFSHPFNLVGDYYQAAYLHRYGQKELAYEKLEQAKEAGEFYKDKAILTLSGMKQVDQDPDESYRLRLGLQKSESIPIVIESNIGIAALLSAEGKHKKALDQLESVIPLLKRVGMTPLFYDVLNSYAVELAETGKFDEASQVISPVLVSPYIQSYPNWLETAEEIREKSRRSIVAIGSTHYNILSLPEPEPNTQPTVQPKPARVLNFARLKKKMDKKDKDQKTKKAIEDMTRQDLGFELLGLITDNDASDEQLRQLVYFAMTLFSEPDDPSA